MSHTTNSVLKQGNMARSFSGCPEHHGIFQQMQGFYAINPVVLNVTVKETSCITEYVCEIVADQMPFRYKLSRYVHSYTLLN